VLNEAYQDTQGTFEDSTTNEREKRVRQMDGVFNWIADKLWDGGKEEWLEPVKRVHSQQVIGALRKFSRDLASDLSERAAEQSAIFGQELVSKMTVAARVTFKDDVDVSIIIRSVKAVVNEITTPEFELDDAEVRALKASGVLREQEANAFLEAATAAVIGLREQADVQITAFVDDLFKNCLPKTIADDFFSDMLARIDDLQAEAENAQRTIDELARAQHALEVF
jgi:hypothetical protein